MEILAATIMIASVVLPALAVLAIAYFVGMLTYSWVVDIAGRARAAAPVSASAQVAPATSPVTTR